jgi:DNA-binding GntR family transcriptional regulator
MTTETTDRTTLGDSYRTLRELAQEAIFRDIVEGRLQPGQKLVEGELVEMYGIRRSPIREALRALEGQGLVKATSNKSVVVSRLTRRELREIYEIRVELEGLAARLAVPLLGAADLARVEELYDRMDGTIDHPREWLRANNEFHLALYAPGGRPRLHRLIRELMTSVEPYIRSFLDVPGKLLDTHADHGLILAVARSGDAAACEREIQGHLTRAMEITLTLLPGDGGLDPREEAPLADVE